MAQEATVSPEQTTVQAPEALQASASPKSQHQPENSEEPVGEMPALPALMELRVHVITTSNVYNDLRFDIFDVATGEVVGRGQGADEGLGEAVATFELSAGTYKIVKAGESFATRVDFATVTIDDDTDFLIVLDADNNTFRGSGVLTDELPTGIKLGGIRFALNLGGSLWMNQKSHVVGGTNGVSALVGVFGNFGMVYDKGPHFLTVDAKAQLNLQNQPTSALFASTDYLEASALYAFNINNDFVGPYARAGLKTRLFPGYLYLAAENAREGTVEVHELGKADPSIYRFGGEAHPDDLRIEVAKSFAPLVMQEELGANLKAVNVDLKLLELSVATRGGWAFRQGFTGGLLVVDGPERGQRVVLNEVDDYTTNGPIVGASANLTFARWLFGQADFSALLPVQNRARAGESFGKRLLLDASGTAGLKFPALTSLLHASFDYSFRLQRDGYLTDALIFDHMVMARVSLQIF